jgi:integrase
VELEPQGNTKYRSIFDAKALLTDAKTELSERDTNSWLVVLLGLGAGLRRKEIDGLRWDQVNLEKNQIFIASHEEFEVKTADSEDAVRIDSFLASELKRFKGQAVPGYVVEPRTQGRPPGASQYYRSNETFVKVTKWLRDHGVDCEKPLHTLRKEFGSIICELADVYAASGALRHRQLSTTTNFYTENRRRTPVPLGALLSAANPESQNGGANDWVI